jgi:peptide/nickel transport system substrate-binding protein
MKLRRLLLLAAISVLLTALPATTARRPRYGGTLQLEIGGAVNSLDPSTPEANPEATSAKEELDRLVYAGAGIEASSEAALNSGPFHVVEWEGGRHAILAANDDYAGGRPFVDSIEIRMGRTAKDRLADLETNKVDLAVIPPEDARLATERGVRMSTSKPDELLALVFPSGRPLAEDAQVREAVVAVIDRTSIANFILQKEGEAAGGLLPQWSSGTAFLFSAASDAADAKEQWGRIGGSPKILLGYDSGDTLEQMVAERIAVNAHEAGISVLTAAGSLSASPKVDARLIRIRMTSSQPRAALADFVAELAPIAGIDTTPLPEAASSQQIYDRERAIISSHRVMPIVWLPEVYGLSERLRDWTPPAPGQGWPLADVWLDGSIGSKSSQVSR